MLVPQAVMSSPASYATTRYEVILLSAGTTPKRVAKAVVANTDRRKGEALELIRAAPVTIIEGAGSATAEGAREALESAGATVELRAYEENAPLPAPSPPLTGGQKALVIILTAIAIIAIAIILALLLLLSFIQSMSDFFSM
jgi:hypothetical protein